MLQNNKCFEYSLSSSSTAETSGAAESSNTEAAATSTNSGSDDNSGSNSSSSTSGTTGGGSSESEQRGSVAEGEVAGVDEEQIAADGISDGDTLVLGAFSEDSTSEEGQTEANTIAVGEQSKQASVDPLEILLALTALAIAGGLITGSAFGNLNLRRYLDIKKVWRFR